MYNQGLAMMDRLTMDLNRQHLDDIHAQVRTERLIPTASIASKIRNMISLFKQKALPAIEILERKPFFNEVDCESVPAPC
jgi:hypothetical protein